ncbi:MAG: hypothetical protein WAN65_08275 [Candidatus Sulfotelmatobacter sp.]
MARQKSGHTAETNGHLQSAAKVQVAPILQDRIKVQLSDEMGKDKYPNLYAHIDPIYDGLTIRRQAGRLSIMVDGSYYRVTLSCPTEKIQTIFILESLVDLLENVEKSLAEGKQVYSPVFDRSKKSKPTLDDLIQ